MKLQSRSLAIGVLVEAWCIAQQFWKNSDNGIPKTVWLQNELAHEIIDVGFAEERGEFVYIKGSAKNFAWLRSSVNNGRKGGLTHRGVDNHSEKSEARLSKSNPPTPPLTPSLKKEELRIRTKGEPRELGFAPNSNSKELATQNEIGKQSSVLIGTYVKAYQGRYGPKARPEITGKAQGNCRAIVKDLGIDRACELIQVYLQINDQWFEKKNYDLVTFMENLNKISLAASTGEQPSDLSATQARQTKWDKLRKELGQ